VIKVIPRKISAGDKLNLKEKKGETALALEKLTAREITWWFEVITLRIEK
jgi:hypothetical protein